MSKRSIQFRPEYEWDFNRKSIKFVAMIDGKRVLCLISTEALNDYFECEDTKENALANFKKNQAGVHKLAKYLIEMNRFNEAGEIVITSDDVRHYGLRV